MDPKTRNVFISHFHGHDAHVDKLTALAEGRGFSLRNSSIRTLKPKNQERWEKKQVKEEPIRRWLRRKVSWAGEVVVLIGKETAQRKWVDWEIEEAHRQGKRIIGVYLPGATDSDLPDNFKKYATSLVAWDPKKIIDAIEGEDFPFENPDGTPAPKKDGVTFSC